jgi:hypothetical protein
LCNCDKFLWLILNTQTINSVLPAPNQKAELREDNLI